MAIRSERTVGQVAERPIKNGLTDEEALVVVQLEIPNANTTLGSIKWYRSTLRASGIDVLTDREVHRRRKPPNYRPRSHGALPDVPRPLRPTRLPASA